MSLLFLFHWGLFALLFCKVTHKAKLFRNWKVHNDLHAAFPFELAVYKLTASRQDLLMNFSVLMWLESPKKACVTVQNRN